MLYKSVSFESETLLWSDVLVHRVVLALECLARINVHKRLRPLPHRRSGSLFFLHQAGLTLREEAGLRLVLCRQVLVLLTLSEGLGFAIVFCEEDTVGRG